MLMRRGKKVTTRRKKVPGEWRKVVIVPTRPAWTGGASNKQVSSM